MTDIEKKLNPWEINFESTIAVQGESQGRTINITVIDRKGQTDGSFNAESIDRPVNLANATVRLYCHKPDGTVTFSDGTVTDAANGIASFILPYQATTVAGNVACEIVIAWPDNSTLKAVGLNLNVQTSSLENAVESSDEYSALVIALNQVGPAVAGAQQAVTDANSALSTANTVIGDINTTETNITAAEAGRTTAESTRVSAETARKTAETARASAESARQTQETARQTSETARASAESARATAESTRVSNENTRLSHEETRGTAETTRSQNETARQTAEQGRAASEADRQTHETDRRNVEDARVGAEQNRVTAEQARATAESSRASAESKRQTDTQTAISDANTARDNANAAAGRANTAAQNAEDAISGQLDPSIDARIAAQKDKAGGIAGYDNVSAHVTNAAIHMATLTCTKSGKVYALTGLTATSGIAPIMFYASDSYSAGDTVTINGVECSLETTDGSALTAGAWAAGAIVRGVVDVDASALTVEPSAPVGAVPTTRKINSHALSADVTLTAADVGAVPVTGGTVTGDLSVSKPIGIISSRFESSESGILNNSNGPIDYGAQFYHVDSSGNVAFISLDGNGNTLLVTTPSGGQQASYDIPTMKSIAAASVSSLYPRSIQATTARASSFLGDGNINLVIG